MSQPQTSSQQINDVGSLSCQDPESKDFDLQAGQSWIYPTNYPVRDYQYNIIEKSLYKNTLVSLPTGLGKTFIAAVVMYNFYRWYPKGKIIFMAPTRPLVKQQLDACYNIMAIPQEVTAELTGSKVQQLRTEIWNDKRVFFITPQVLQNDLEIIVELGAKIKCLVFDEAHRAKGKHAYCEVIRNLLPRNKLFRVLALSATPGNSSKDVIEVMRNLLIAHVEFRSEDSLDVKPYVFERALETVVVPLGEKLQQVKDQYLQVLEKHTRTLIQFKLIDGNCANLSKGRIFLIKKEFETRNTSNRHPKYTEIMKTLHICLTLYHAYENLIRCGLRAFFNFFEEHINNPLLSGNMIIRQILEDLRSYLGPNPNVEHLPDGGFTEVPASTKFGHPKFYKLRDILMTHFKNSDASSRIIVFFEYRESVNEAFALLSQSYPLIKARIFVGQGSGVTQRAQINTVKAFREGTCNTLLSTCIGEEGLDVGEVDLIVCFEVANKSPIRMIQRMGRTGRKKEGRVVVLVTEGKEQQTLKDCLIYKNNLGNFVGNSQHLEAGKYQDNPRMIPEYMQLKCQKMFISVKPPLKKNGSLKDYLKKIDKGPRFDDDIETNEIQERIKTKIENFWDKETPLDFDFEQPKIDFGRKIEKQRAFQNFGIVKKSKQTEIFVSLLQSADSKRFNIPLTQKGFSNFQQNKLLKQGDIRSMFSKAANNLSQETDPIDKFSNFQKEKDITHSFPEEFFDEISTFLTISAANHYCKTCEFLFKCTHIDREVKALDLSAVVIPDLSLVDSITAQDFEVFLNSSNLKKNDDFMDLDDDVFNDVTFSECFEEADKSMKYETPRDFDKILKSFRVNEEEETKPVAEKPFGFQPPKNLDNILKSMHFEEEQIEDVTKDQAPKKVLKPIHFEEHSISETLSFFKLSSLSDLFTEAMDLDQTLIYSPEICQVNEESPKKCEQSPDLFASSDEIIPDSPVLCSYERSQTLKAKKKLFNASRHEETVKKPTLSNLHKSTSFFFNTANDCDNSLNVNIEDKQSVDLLDISKLCDLSQFGLEKPVDKANLSIDDLCEMSDFFADSFTEKKEADTSVRCGKEPVEEVDTFKDICEISDFFCDSVAATQKKEDVVKELDQFKDICDVSDFFGDTFTESKTKEIIDLTDSPRKNPETQFSVTQMLSLVAKSDSQKENTSPKPKKSPSLSLKNVLKPKLNVKSQTPKRKRLNISLVGDSDDEFEDTSKSPIFAKPKPKCVQTRKGSVGEKASCSKKRRKLSGFIDYEAEVSEDERVVLSEDEDSGEDCFEASFVADETQDLLNTTNMHAKYLQSVKSPQRGVFKIPQTFKHNVSNVFSQEDNDPDNTYLNDSFCVPEDVGCTQRQDMSELDLLELKLKEMRKNKKRKMSGGCKGEKRRRVIRPSDDSD